MDVETMIDEILVKEGGYVNHPADRGGPTNFGITQKTLSRYLEVAVTAEMVKALDVETARDIYELNTTYPSPPMSKSKTASHTLPVTVPEHNSDKPDTTCTAQPHDGDDSDLLATTAGYAPLARAPRHCRLQRCRTACPRNEQTWTWQPAGSESGRHGGEGGTTRIGVPGLHVLRLGAEAAATQQIHGAF